MILYHGSTTEVSQPRIFKSEIGRDFGFAFCTEAALRTLHFQSSYLCGSVNP